MEVFTVNSQEKKGSYRICISPMIQLLITITISLLLIPFNVYAESSNVKWHPGHYMRFKDSHSENNMKKFLSNKYTKGMTIQIAWKDLEERFNEYNFEKIDKFLNLVSSYNKFLILDIEVRCFNSNCTHGNVPAYLRSDSSYNGGVEKLTRSDGSVKGSTARLWDAAVVDRIISLIEFIGNEYDNNPNLVGVSLPSESAIALKKTQGGYTPKAYETQLKRIASAMSLAMPKTIGLTGLNFFPRSGDTKAVFSRIAEHLVKTGQGGITHPDTIPQGYDVPIYEIETAFSDKLAVVAQFQTWNIRNEISEEAIFTFATKKLGAQFVVWNQMFTSKFSGSRPNYITNYVLPVVNKYQGKTAGSLPKSFIGPTELPAPQLSIVENN
jgi:hypothetical protein